jgi:hypothetical protein
MQTESCTTCGKSKSLLNCGVCTVSVCKSCAQILPEDAFSFLTKKKPEMAHTLFCNSCFDQHIAADLANYNETMEKAKEVLVYFKSQSKETRLIRRIEKPISVVDCADHDETLMRLAFVAAQLGCNAVIDIDLVTKKVRLGSYQTQVFSATGMPTNVNMRNIVKDRSTWQNPN